MEEDMRRLILLIALLGIFSLYEGTVRAEEIQPSLKVNFLLQPWFYFAENEAALKKNGFGYDFYLRRARIIVSGNLNDWIYFFYETDNPNFGKARENKDKGIIERNYDTIYTQDAFVDFRIAPEIQIATGMILLPFSHHDRQSAVTIHTIDFHNIFSGHLIQEKAWRDFGVEARGLVFGKLLGYHFGLFSGKTGTSDQIPRMTGRVDVNCMDAEDTFFYNGIYFGKKKIISLGLGFDLQPGAIADKNGNTAMYYALTGDAFVDYPIGENDELIFQTGAAWYERGYVKGIADAGTGLGLYGEIGYRMGKFEPVLSFNSFDSKKSGEDTSNILAGLNIWLKEKNANIKLEYGLLKKQNVTARSIMTIQTQLFF
jgi:hypothetical protein